MRFSTCSAPVVAAVALACSLARGADPDDPEPWRYGVQVLAASPRQDFRSYSGRTGFGVGALAEATPTPGTVVQTRIDYIRYPQTNQPSSAGLPSLFPANPLTFSADSVAVSGDVHYHLPAKYLRSFYLLGGLTAIRYEFETSYATTQVDVNGIPTPGINRVKTKTSVKMGVALGFGYDFTSHLSLSERFTTLDIDGNTFGALETALSYRF
jgi:hypothetical protein